MCEEKHKPDFDFQNEMFAIAETLDSDWCWNLCEFGPVLFVVP